MKKNIFPILVFLLFAVSGCGLSKVKRLQDCEFRVTTLQNTTLGGVNFQGVNSLWSINLSDMMTLGNAVSNGRLPLCFTLNAEAHNPNKLPASMTKVDWIAMIDDDEVASGAVEQRIEIPGMGTATIPFVVRTDLMQLLRGKSKDALLNYGMGLAGASNEPTRVTIKLKPYMHIGKKSIAYPGFFQLTEEFAAP